MGTSNELVDKLSYRLRSSAIPHLIVSWGKDWCATYDAMPIILPNIHRASLNLVDMVFNNRESDIDFVLNQLRLVCSGINLNRCEVVDIEVEFEVLHQDHVTETFVKVAEKNDTALIICIPVYLDSGEQLFFTLNHFVDIGFKERIATLFLMTLDEDIYEMADVIHSMTEDLLLERKNA